MKLYHGSAYRIEKPELLKGKPNNDYGQGFYCSKDLEMAREWACKGYEPPAYANTYELDLSGLRVLDLSCGEYTVLNWIAVLLANRTFQLDLEVAVEVRNYFIANFMPPISESDVVIGYRADDSYFDYAETFVENGLSIGRLNEALRLGKLGLQVALRSRKAFGQIAFVDAEAVPWDAYHARYVRRDADARNEWRTVVKSSTLARDDLFAMDIVRKGLKHGDEGLCGFLPC